MAIYVAIRGKIRKIPGNVFNFVEMKIACTLTRELTDLLRCLIIKSKSLNRKSRFLISKSRFFNGKSGFFY